MAHTCKVLIYDLKKIHSLVPGRMVCSPLQGPPVNVDALKESKEACADVWELLRPRLDSVANSSVRLAKMSGLLDALLLQFQMPPPALFDANDIDKCGIFWQKSCTVQGMC